MRLRNPQQLGLTTRHLAVELGVAEKRRAFALVPDLGCLALRVELLLAHVAPPAGDVEGDHDSVSGLDLGYLGAHGLDNSHGLVAQDVALVHKGAHDLVKVQIGAADPAGGDPDDRVGRLLDRGIRHGVDADVSPAVERDGLHGKSS